MQQMILNTVLRALAAVVIGGLIGSERARHGRAAGMRTHILVCLGSCMTSMTSMYVANMLGNNGDVLRIPAQVVSGIGFYIGTVAVTALFLSAIVLFARFERKRKLDEVIYIEIDDAHKVNEVLKNLKQ